jgi:hypothetical protein
MTRITLTWSAGNVTPASPEASSRTVRIMGFRVGSTPSIWFTPSNKQLDRNVRNHHDGRMIVAYYKQARQCRCLHHRPCMIKFQALGVRGEYCPFFDVDGASSGTSLFIYMPRIRSTRNILLGRRKYITSFMKLFLDFAPAVAHACMVRRAPKAPTSSLATHDRRS